MAENKQNAETKNTGSATDDKTAMGSGGTSTRQAKDENPTPTKMTNPTESSVGKGAPQSAGSGGAIGATSGSSSNAQESVGAVTSEAIGQAKEKAGSVLEEQKTNLAAGITGVADSIRQVGEKLGGANEDSQVAALAGKYGETLAGQVEKFSSYIEDKEIRELIRDVEQFARRNPVLFVSGAFALGVVAARFLKSSSRNQTSRRSSQRTGTRNYLAGQNTRSDEV